MEQFFYIVKVEHIKDKFLLQRDMTAIPSKGDWIEVGNDVYVVLNVSWNFSDRRTVTLLVDNISI
jgi:hypothetical protein